MNNDHKNEEWMKLCQQAAVEPDPERLLLLAREISRLLKEREETMKNPKAHP
jgi:hypothetical protein